MRPWVIPALLSAAALFSLPITPAHSQSLQADNHSGVFVPESSIEQSGDNGVRAHTNHVVRVSPFAGTGSPTGETPQSIRPVYNLPSTGGSGVIAIVDAYDYPTAKNDFNVFSGQFSLPQETGTGAVFQVVYASRKKPRGNGGWNQEAALDIEWAHAMAPSAKIVLVEAASSSFTDLFAAVKVASGLRGVKEVSMSWGGSEFSGELADDSYFTTPGIVYFASSGDTGGVTGYPGVSPSVVCAGGTTIHRTSSGVFASETGWSGSGGGFSQYELRPFYQDVTSGTVGGARGVPDYSFDADPNSGVSVYDSTSYQGLSGWLVFGGTSVASPSLAGIVNLAHDANTGTSVVDTTDELKLIYSSLGTTATPTYNSTDFRDILSGTAGSYTATTGWDFVTGVGSNLGLNGK